MLICYFASNITSINIWKADGKSTKQHLMTSIHFLKNVIIFYSPSPSNSTAIALEYNPTSSSRRWLDSTCSGPLRSSMSWWTFTSPTSGFSNGGFQPNPACLIRRDIIELKGVVKPHGTTPVLVILRDAYVVSLDGTTTSPSLVLSRYKPLQEPMQSTAFGCKTSTALFTTIADPPGSPPPSEHVIKATFSFTSPSLPIFPKYT